METSFALCIVLAFIAAIMTALCSAYFNTRNGKTFLYKLAEETANKVLEQHIKEKHQDSMYKYVEVEINKHKVDCGNKLTSELQEFRETLQELYGKLFSLQGEQIGIHTNLKFVSLVTLKIAEKLQIPIDSDLSKSLGG